MAVACVLPADIDAQVATALAEDIGAGDATGALVPEGRIVVAEVITRDAITLCGLPWAERVFAQLDPRVRCEAVAEEGAVLEKNQLLLRLEGPARALLAGERCALNFLQLLSGTATRTRCYVDLLAGTGTRLLDTRKTLPGLRSAQKYAVRCGGGENHRMGLYDALLIKENHIAACGGLAATLEHARSCYSEAMIEVEVENLDELKAALASSVSFDRILLDNFSLDQLRKAVAWTQGRIPLDASGGIDAQNMRAVAETGVDFIALGTLTKDIQAADLSMRFLETLSHE